MENTHVLGLDGGGSGTRCVIASASGNILANGIGGPSNPLTAGLNEAAEAIETAAKEASSRSGITKFATTVMGVAGTERKSIVGALEEKLRKLGFDGFRIVSDAEVALAGVSGSMPGVVVISGTGSIAYGKNVEGKTARAGGWGWRLGDEGSGYEIGHSALIAALRDYDGRGPQTLLRRMVEEKLSLKNPSDLVDRIYTKGMGSEEIAALASLVGSAAEGEDKTAIKILRKAGSELGLAASSVIARLGLRGRFTLGLVGGVFSLGPAIEESLVEVVRNVAPECRIAPPRFPPEVGAALLALREIGVKLDEALLESVETSQKAMTGGSS